jgi:protein disulfide-isomerase A1
MLLQAGTPLAHIFVQTDEECRYLANMLKHIAVKYRGKLNFATINATEYGFFASALNLIPGRFPAFVIEDFQTGQTIPFDQSKEITTDAIETFVENYFEEGLKSPKVPEV